MARATKAVSNTSLHAARRAKNDEFYTQLTDIEKELRHYKAHFRGKSVFCNCDDPQWSNFWRYFTLNFEHLGLTRVVATHYAAGKPSYKLEYRGANEPLVQTPLEGDGDFRSDECVALLKEADIVVTNPPFSLFREYLAQLIEHDKQFLIIGNNNAITYKETFAFIRSNRVWLGYGSNKTLEFQLAPDYEKWSRIDEHGNKFGKVPAISWFTNLPHQKRAETLILFRHYHGNEQAYPKYDNYDAIEVSKVADIPMDYDGAMGVPITFLDKYNPEQFEVLGVTDRDNDSGLKTREYSEADAPNHGDLNRRGVLKLDRGYKSTYARLLIKRKIT